MDARERQSTDRTAEPEIDNGSFTSRTGRHEGVRLLDVSDLCVRFRVMGVARARLRGVRNPFVDAVLNASLTLMPGETIGLVG